MTYTARANANFDSKHFLVFMVSHPRKYSNDKKVCAVYAAKFKPEYKAASLAFFWSAHRGGKFEGSCGPEVPWTDAECDAFTQYMMRTRVDAHYFISDDEALMMYIRLGRTIRNPEALTWCWREYVKRREEIYKSLSRETDAVDMLMDLSEAAGEQM